MVRWTLNRLGNGKPEDPQRTCSLLLECCLNSICAIGVISRSVGALKLPICVPYQLSLQIFTGYSSSSSDVHDFPPLPEFLPHHKLYRFENLSHLHISLQNTLSHTTSPSSAESYITMPPKAANVTLNEKDAVFLINCIRNGKEKLMPDYNRVAQDTGMSKGGAE